MAAVEIGSKNHKIVPTPLIIQISGLRGASGVNKSISTLAKSGLIAKVKNARCLSPGKKEEKRGRETVADTTDPLQTMDTG